ncbi:hypothetical protein CUMW_001000 [Citrus unshiu]|nr:hypothetical protein CUMW_001000 [Citrus unshiu]
MALTCGIYVIRDTDGNILFKVKGVLAFMYLRRVLLDGAGNSMLLSDEKTRTAHYRWQVFRGGSTKPRDFIFTAN